MIEIQLTLDFTPKKIIKKTPVVLPERTFVPITIETSFRFGDCYCCTYCGQPANEVEHCLPYSFLTLQRRTSSVRDKGVTTYACRSCNAMLSDKFFDRFRNRLIYVRKKITQTNQRVLKQPMWAEWELRELDWSLQTFVRKKQREKKIALERISWFETERFKEIMRRLMDKPELNPGWSSYHTGLAEFFSGGFEDLDY